MSDDLDEMERKLRELWSVTLPKSALADEDRAVAVKLLGADGARRLAATKRGERYRYRPQAIQKIEYHFVPAGDGKPAYEMGWTIEATQNHVRRTLGRLLPHERCGFIVRELTKRGYRVDLVVTEPMKRAGVLCLPLTSRQHRPPSKPQQDRSKRFAIMDNLRGFRP